MVEESDGKGREAKQLDVELEHAQPRVEALLDVADKIDREKAELTKELDVELACARDMLRRDELLSAAVIYDAVSAKFRDRGFHGDADAWARRAGDCRDAERLKKRNRRKGRANR